MSAEAKALGMEGGGWKEDSSEAPPFAERQVVSAFLPIPAIVQL